MLPHGTRPLGGLEDVLLCTLRGLWTWWPIPGHRGDVSLQPRWDGSSTRQATQLGQKRPWDERKCSVLVHYRVDSLGLLFPKRNLLRTVGP